MVTRFLLIVLFLPFVAQAQNLVPNGDFEKHEKCPTESAQYTLLSEWKSASQATPDLLCNCANETSLVNTILNFAGRQDPHSGNCYAGILAYHSEEYYEYLQVQLTAPLVKNQKYLLSFYYTLSDFSNQQVSSMGALFRNDVYQAPGQPRLNEWSVRDSIQNNIRLWKEFKVIYSAKGGEQYMVLGCFSPKHDKAYPDKAPQGYGPQDNDRYAYYYIDDVSLTAYSGPDLIKETPRDLENPVKRNFVPEPVYFNINKSDIPDKYRPSLEALATYMKQNPTSKLTVRGHTDNTGDEGINQPLSLQRAEAVKAWLVKKGIHEKRITCTSHSSNNPVKPNDSDANKQKNRRVEFILTSR